MKNLNPFFTVLFCFFLLFSPKLLAQDSFRLKVNSVFQNVDKSQVPTQHLMEFGYPFLPINKFDGTLVDSNKTDITVWRMLYASFLTSYVGTNAPSLPALSTVNTTIDNAETSTTAIPISLLHVNYNDLRPDAVTAGLMTVSNEQIFDVVGRSQSPYRSQTLFAAAPSVNYSYTPVIKFVFTSDLIFKNTGNINSIAVDFADGIGYRSVSIGTVINVNYSSVGTYRIKVKLTPVTGAIVESWFDFEANSAVCTTCLYSPTREQFLTDASFQPSSLHSGGIISFILSINNNTGRIRNPLIVAKGFDAFSSAPKLAKRRYDMSQFIDGINNAASDGYNFNFNLDNGASYDLVFINYNNGTDDIKRNAALLQAVIRRVNAQKQAGDPQNVVMGLSMGGLVARYGLAQMVRNGENPQTRLLITHDSPHRGANVPLCFQYIGRAAVLIGIFSSSETIFAQDILPYAVELNNLLNSTAAAQQILFRATGTTLQSVVNNTFLADGGEYRTMVDNVPSQPYQVIATSNGSQCATPLFPPNSVLLQGDVGGFLSAIPWVFQAGVRTSIEMRSASQQAVSQVLNWRIYSQIKIFTIPINVTISRFTADGPAINAFDGTPGGTINLPVSKMDRSSNWWIILGYSINYTGQSDFCFVPTSSGLDATNFSSFTPNERYINGVNLTNPSRFSRFIAQNTYQKQIDPANSTTITSFNSRHISFRGRTSHWLFDQMENVTPSTNQECSSECTSSGVAAITGNSAFCSTSNYSVNTPSGTPVTWTVTPSGIASITSSGNTATLTRITDGNVTLTAKVGSCITLNQSIQIGSLPPPAFVLMEVERPCPPTSTIGTYNINPIASGVTYSWQCSGCDGGVNLISADGTSVYINLSNPGSYTLQATAMNNTCSFNSTTVTQTYTTQTGCGSPMRVALSPNPARSQLTINVVDDNANTNGRIDNSYQVTISDFLNNIKYNAKHTTPDVTIDISALNVGTYSMRIVKGQNVVTKIFSVTH